MRVGTDLSSLFSMMCQHRHCRQEGGAWLLPFDSDSTKRVLRREGGREERSGRREEGGERTEVIRFF